MKWTIVPPALMLGGVVLIIIGFVWPRAVGNAGWNEQQAQRRSTAGADVHRLQYEHAFATEPEEDTGGYGRGVGRLDDNKQVSVDRIKAELDRAHEEWDRAEAELNWARARRSVPAFLFWFLGVVCCALGVLGYFVLRMEWVQQYIDV